MYHLACYTEAIDNTADNDVTALADDILTIQNNHFILQQPMKLIAAYAGSATLSRAKIASPTMRQVASPFIRPISVALLPPTNANVWILDQQPFSLVPFEEIQMQATSGVAMTERFTGLIWLQDMDVPIPSGNLIPLRFTSTTAAVANTWTTLTIAFADTVPTGQYAMVLSECQSTNALAHRWIISNQYWRPGHLGFATLGSRLPYAISKGQFGLMGYFKSNDLPRLQVLANAADAAHEGYLYAIRTGPIYGS